MKEKTIFTKKEWKEIEEMQQQAKAKRQAEAQQRQAKRKEEKKDKIIGFIMLLFIGGSFVYMFAPVIIEYLKIIID